jgi:hypothetical protein
MNQRSPSVSTVKFFNKIRHERSFHNHALCELLEPALRDFYEAPGAPRQIPFGSDLRVQIAD